MKKLTKEKALERIEYIKFISNDEQNHGEAHEEEDKLHYWFICCVADNMYAEKELSEIANIVISTNDIDFTRWYE